MREKMKILSSRYGNNNNNNTEKDCIFFQRLLYPSKTTTKNANEREIWVHLIEKTIFITQVVCLYNVSAAETDKYYRKLKRGLYSAYSIITNVHLIGGPVINSHGRVPVWNKDSLKLSYKLCRKKGEMRSNRTSQRLKRGKLTLDQLQFILKHASAGQFISTRHYAGGRINIHCIDRCFIFKQNIC